MLRIPLFVPIGPLLLVAGLGQASAQAPTPAYGSDCPSKATVVADLLRDADALGIDNVQTLHCFARATAQAVAEHDAVSEAAARFRFATAAYSQASYGVAEPDARAALALYERLGDAAGVARATRLLGNIQLTKGDRAGARTLLESARAAFTALKLDRDLARILLDLDRLETDKGPSIDLINESIQIARSIGASDLEGSALHAKADLEFGEGRYDEAIRDLNAAIERFQAQPTTKVELANAYVSLGRLLRAHGRYAEALEYYDRAGVIQEQVGDLRGLVQSTNAKAVAYEYLGKTPEMRAMFERALELAKRTGSARLITFEQGGLASALAAEGKLEEANHLLEDVIQRETDPYILAYRYTSLASNLRDLHQYERAADSIVKAVELCRSTNNREFLSGVLYRFALIYGDLNRIDEALAAATEGVEVVEQIRARLVPRDFLKRGFSDTYQEIFGVTLALLYKRGEYERALVVSEQARARAFLDLLASRDAPASGAAPAGLEKQVDPNSLASESAARPASAADIAETARRLKSAIVSYWVSDDETFIWVVRDGETVHQARVAIKRKPLEDLIASSMRPRDPRALMAFTRLHALLIDPVKHWLPSRGASLTIVPYGPLSRLSFAALREPGGAYLVERYAIAYAPSISTLFLTKSRAARTMGTGYLLVADPAPMPALRDAESPSSSGTRSGAAGTLPPLPASRREVSAIHTVLGDEGTVLAGTAARESEIRRRAPDVRVLHFATHGVLRDDEPFDSFLAVGAEGEGAAVDGRLTVRELYDLRLSADLVVLSACRTATGPISGDGIAGLSRAFFYAGTPTVLATLWDVADDPSATLMATFYRQWRAGADKGTALRRAQLDLIRQLRSGAVRVKAPGGAVIPLQEHPFYWAGYILIGER